MWHDIREGKIGPVRLVRSTSRDPPGMTTKEYLILSGKITLDCRFVQVFNFATCKMRDKYLVSCSIFP